LPLSKDKEQFKVISAVIDTKLSFGIADVNLNITILSKNIR